MKNKKNLFAIKEQKDITKCILKGMTLKQIAQELADELNITKQAISNIETGKSCAGLNLLSKLLIDYGVNLNYIIGGTGNIFLQDENAANSLKQSILNEVEKMLTERGIN